MPAKPPESTPDRIRSEPPRNSFSPRPTFSRPARRSQYRAVTASGGTARKGPLHGTQRSLHLGGCVRAGATLRGRAPLTPAPTSSRPPRAALRKNPHPVVRRARKRSARALEAPPRHGLAGGIVAVPPRRHQAPPSRSAAGGTATRLRVKIAGARGDRRGARELGRSSLRLGGDGVLRQETRMSGSLLALVLLVAVGPS
jgi:hypothetical protein